MGIEPGGLVWKTSVSTTTRPPATARAALWRFEQAVGIEPTEAGVAHQPVTLNRLHLSHPLELNQNLSGFGRARRPATPEWEIALRAPRGDTQRLNLWVLASTLIVIALQLSQITLGVRRAHLGR